jgi:D-methionine transport system substrate-binding protein
MKLTKILVSILVWALCLSGCEGCNKKSSPAAEKTSIKIGVIGGPETELMEKIKEVAKHEQGLDLELVVFNDYMTPNIALNDKSIDANSFQHEPYLNEMVKSRGFKLVSAGKTFVYPLAAYSKKITTAKDLKPGSKVAIPNDPTNESRALLLLERQGLIQLKDPTNLLLEKKDIIKNPLNLTIIELEAAQLPRALDDVDVAIINTTFAKAAGLSPTKNGLFVEGSDSLYVNIIAVRQEDKDAPWVKKLVKSVQNDQIKKAAEAIFQDGVIAGWLNGDADDGIRDD